MPAPALSERERIFLKLLLKEGTLRNKDFSDLTETPASTTNTTLNRLREAGLGGMVGEQRALTPLRPKPCQFARIALKAESHGKNAGGRMMYG